MKIEEVTSELLKRAIALYLEAAYPAGGWSEAVAERTRLHEGVSGAELLAEDRFERVPADAPVAEARRFNLRLGNAGYPHMKLGIDRVAGTDEFVLVVDTHDKHFAAMVQGSEEGPYRELLAQNERVRRQVELAWNDAGLPTFEAYLRGRLKAMRSSGDGKKSS